MTARRSVAAAAGWSGMSNIVLRLGGVVVGIILARILTPEEFGIYAVALAAQAVLLTLVDLGLSAEIVRSEDPEPKIPTIATLGLVLGAAITTCAILWAAPLAELLGSADAAPAIAVLAVTVVLGGAGVVPYALLMRRFQQRELFAISAVDFVVSTAVTLVLIGLGWGVVSLAVGRVSAQAVSLVLQFVAAKVRPRFGLDLALLRPIVAFGAPVALANLVAWLLLGADKVVISTVVGVTALGFYTLAFNVSNWPMSALSQMVRSISLPLFSSAGKNHADDMLARVTGIAWAGAFPAGVVLAVLSEQVIGVVYGEKWLPAAPALAALGAFGAIRVLFDVATGFLYSRGRSGLVFWIQCAWAVALISALIPATHLYGIVGAGLSQIGVAVLVVLPAFAVMLRMARVRVRSVLREMAWPTVAAIAAGGVAAGVSHLVDGAVIELLSGGASAVAVYLALMWRWGRTRVRGLRAPQTQPAGERDAARELGRVG